jgi:hypothetical protein
VCCVLCAEFQVPDKRKSNAKSKQSIKPSPGSFFVSQE